MITQFGAFSIEERPDGVALVSFFRPPVNAVSISVYEDIGHLADHIAAIKGPAVGVGVMLAGMCDMRVASEDARLACPEVDYGLIGGSAGLLASLRMPEAKVREMVYTGRSFTARELENTGFFNYIVPRPAVLPLALDLAEQIAGKNLKALRARKLASLMFEGPDWMEAYLEAQEASSALVEHPDSAKAVQRALVKGRRAR